LYLVSVVDFLPAVFVSVALLPCHVSQTLSCVDFVRELHCISAYNAWIDACA